MNRIRELRIRAGLQQKELAIKAGVSHPTVSDWELGKKNPTGERLKRLQEIFGVDAATILGYEPLFIPMKRNAVPIVGEIACGLPILADENIIGSADLPNGVHADFALRCKGESMVPTFNNGDLVLIRQQPEVETGQIAAVGIDGETTLKHVYTHKDGLLLTADNAAFAPIYIPANSGKEITIYGLAVGYLRYF